MAGYTCALPRLAAMAFTILAAGAAAQDYPTRSIRMVAPFSAGGGADALARLLARGMTDILGQQVLVDNRGGGSGIIGTELVVKAAPDGRTIGFIMAAHAINAATRDRLPYDSVRGFATVSLFATVPFVLVSHPAFPAKSVPELIELARSKPGQIDFASTGPGSVPHLAGEMLKAYGKVNLNHVSYKGVSGAVADVLGGAVPLTFQGPLGVMPLAAAGKLRALALTSAKRSPQWPALPTVQEGGVPGYELINWYGVIAPLQTPRVILGKLNDAVLRAAGDKETQKGLSASAATPAPTSPDEFRAFISKEVGKFTEVARRIGGIRLD
jgi:tripartite-type tricarboxylate transporter receptor subunit TctC